MSNEREHRRGLMLVISSPSGAGKSSLGRRLLEDHQGIDLSVSCTTRPPRPGEVDGRDYHFIDRAEFDAKIAEDDFLEWDEVHDNRYGTPRAPVMAALEAGRDILFDIDWQGARQIWAAGAEDVLRVYVLPPSMAELRKRLFARAQDSAEVIERRLARAKAEIARWNEYDYVLVNDDFERVYAELTYIYRAERDRRLRNPWLNEVVQRLLDEPI